MQNQHTPVISFVAKSGTGKTTLIEKIIPVLKSKGYKLGVIKHDAHRFDIDKPGKDSWRMTQAGADSVLISSPEKVALIEQVEEEKNLDELIAMLPEVNLILTEGFKRNNKPKIEISRSEVSNEILSDPAELLAIASDVVWDVGVPCYHIDDVEGIVNEIIKYLSK
jgi:molybdopterin-guanine dinucleotide biosynthesis protein B